MGVEGTIGGNLEAGESTVRSESWEQLAVRSGRSVAWGGGVVVMERADLEELVSHGKNFGLYPDGIGSCWKAFKHRRNMMKLAF